MVETIVVVAIIGMMLALALPYFAQTMRRSRMTAEARQIFMPLLKARLEAIKRGNNVNVEISTDSSGTPQKLSYRQAVVYVDTDASGNYNSGDTLIAAFPLAPSGDPTLRIDDADPPGSVTTPSTAAQTIEWIFTPLGTLDAASTTKAAYISDGKGNLLQVAVLSSSNAKATMTKQLTGSTFVAQPWQWY